jgi:hypothetical protein
MAEGSESLATAASERVRAIVQAAESSAAEIERAAHEDAERIRAEAAQSTHGLVDRLRALEQELATLVEELQGGAGRVAAELASLQADLGVAGGGAGAPVVAAAAPAPAPAPAAKAKAAAPAASVAPPPVVAAKTDADDSEGARLVALDMALSGKPREEAERYLAEHFDLSDGDALLDEVYASAAGS